MIQPEVCRGGGCGQPAGCFQTRVRAPGTLSGGERGRKQAGSFPAGTRPSSGNRPSFPPRPSSPLPLPTPPPLYPRPSPTALTLSFFPGALAPSPAAPARLIAQWPRCPGAHQSIRPGCPPLGANQGVGGGPGRR